MSTETHTGTTPRADAQRVFTALSELLDDCGVRDGTSTLVTHWLKTMDASGVPMHNAAADRAWRMLYLHPGGSARDQQGDKTPVEAVAKLAAETLSAPERLQLAQFLLATVATNVEDAPEATGVTYDVTVTAGGSTSRSARNRRADLDAAKKSVLDSLETIDSTQVARILAPTGAAVRSVAQKRRAAGDLIGLPVGTRPNYLYPLFQFDTPRHKIHEVVCHANRRLFVNKDPYGAASWWLTASDLLDGNSPLEDLEAGQLTEIAVDNMIDDARQGM